MGFPEGMVGTWNFNGKINDSWGDATSRSAKLIFTGDDLTAQFTVNLYPNVNTEVELVRQDDGSYQGTYKQGSNQRILTVWFEDGVVYFGDNYDLAGKNAMTKA